MVTRTDRRIAMPDTHNNVIEFPLNRRTPMRGCPQCGSRGDVWQIGRLVWGYCTAHEVRWVVANLPDTSVLRLDRRRMRRGLELLSGFVEVSH